MRFCTQCHQNCLTCSAAANCQTCKPNFVLLNGACNCPNGRFINSNG
jgi:hypothetical protein